jgi:hypothetical protein
MKNGEKNAQKEHQLPSVVFQAQRGANAVPMLGLVIFARGVTEA